MATGTKKSRVRGTVPTTRRAKDYLLKVTLLGSDPPVWRRLRVPGDVTLARLHRILQIAMGWEDDLLHQFETKGSYYSDPRCSLDYVKDESRVTLNRLLTRSRMKLVYEYDFGDSWIHEVRLEKTEAGRGDARAVCLDGERACPPEDSGGLGGYEHLAGVLSNPEHPEHDELAEWCGEGFDPEAFDLEAVNRALSRLR
jgi:hypothetical protein